MIPPAVESLFPAAVRQRGRAYWREGRVGELGGFDDAITAWVRGSSDYLVTLDTADSGRLRVSCDCPFAADHLTCKHSWAVILEADERGLLDDLYGATGVSRAPREVRPPPAARGAASEWQRRLKELRQASARRDTGADADTAAPPLERPLGYRLQLDELRASGQVNISIVQDGRHPHFSNEQWLHSAVAHDRELAHRLLGAQRPGVYPGAAEPRRFTLPPTMYATTLRTLCDTGHLTFATTGPLHGAPVRWLGDAPWTPHFAVHALADDGGWRLQCTLRRGADALPLEEAELVTAHGLLVTRDGLAPLDAGAGWPLLWTLRRGGPLDVPHDALFDLAAELHLMPDAPHVELPAEAAIEQVHVEPVPRLVVRPEPLRLYDERLQADLTFRYGGVTASQRRGGAIIDRERRRIIVRAREREAAARARLLELGARRERSWHERRVHTVIPRRKLQSLVLTLVAEGWEVEAEGRSYRAASATTSRIASGIDWFELQAGATFGDQHVPLPRLLAALRSGERTIRLDDGSSGLLPETWLRRYVGIAELGTDSDDGAVRFAHSQAALLDALLAVQPEVDADAAFTRVRNRLRGFERVQPNNAPRGFRGELRPYQKDALGWFAFLRDLGLGGCLADDMGLGKTVQVLALLEARRQQRAGPSLVVVPKSLVFNWQREAERFTPRLRVRDYTGTARRRDALDPDSFDLLVTTYGTLRRDAPHLRELEFDYVVLDEAQAIRNAATASAKAARLLRGRHRLALTGTPVENRIDDLWSLFEFLNPGLLGAAGGFAALRGASRGTVLATETRSLLARTLRPFLLRRTKEQVAPDLPPRTEQTLVVELEPEQRRLYDELRDHFRAELLGHIDRVGIARSKMRILEALLRLRQAAIHPGLIDASRNHESSAKLDMLMQTLGDVVAEGHRALVFSQFTSCLALVRDRLDRAGVRYEYLDGRTRDREARVQRFQQGDACPVFLISLRAGGHGLNLTAADYVFMLDPWWNPAVEAQAIDRTHRIGQQRPVIALRLIARDTVEEKVIALQQAKRELADAILGEDAGLMTRITREDLELLLG